MRKIVIQDLVKKHDENKSERAIPSTKTIRFEDHNNVSFEVSFYIEDDPKKAQGLIIKKTDLDTGKSLTVKPLVNNVIRVK